MSNNPTPSDCIAKAIATGMGVSNVMGLHVVPVGVCSPRLTRDAKQEDNHADA